MKLLLIFIFCLISRGGEAYRNVTGYSGGGVLIKCRYQPEPQSNPTYFCRVSGSGCTELIKTKDKDKWSNTGRFSVFGNSSVAELWVLITELTVEDSGRYQCGVEEGSNTTVNLEVKEDRFHEISVIGRTGDDVNISCKYPQSHRNESRFLCKKDKYARCKYKTQATQSGKWIEKGKFSMYHDGEQQIFTIKNLTNEDFGEYWCGVQADWKSDDGYKVYITQINLTVVGGGEAYRNVTGYSGGGVLIKCKYQPEPQSNPTYFCRVSGSGCTELIKTKDKDKWSNTGRFSVFGNSSVAELWVLITELTVEDSGRYQCGVEEGSNTTVNLEVKEDRFHEISVIGQTGDDVNISCKYPQSHRNESRFLCKKEKYARCKYKTQATQSGKWIEKGKFSVYHDGEQQIFTIRNLTDEDFGEYWCGVQADWKSDDGYKVYITQINLTVVAFPVSSLITVVCVIPLALTGLLFFSITLALRKRKKTQDPSHTSHAVYANLQLPTRPCDSSHPLSAALEKSSNSADQSTYCTTQLPTILSDSSEGDSQMVSGESAEGLMYASINFSKDTVSSSNAFTTTYFKKENHSCNYATVSYGDFS